MKLPALLFLALALGCTSTGDAPALHKMERESVEHGKVELTQYALNMLALVAGQKTAALQIDYETQKTALLDAAENQAAAILKLEKSYQAHLDLIQADVLGEFQKIARIWQDFENAAALGTVVDKALESAGQVDVEAIIDYAASAAGAIESVTGLKLGPLTDVLEAIKNARGLPKLANTNPINPE